MKIESARVKAADGAEIPFNLFWFISCPWSVIAQGIFSTIYHWENFDNIRLWKHQIKIFEKYAKLSTFLGSLGMLVDKKNKINLWKFSRRMENLSEINSPSVAPDVLSPHFSDIQKLI